MPEINPKVILTEKLVGRNSGKKKNQFLGRTLGVKIGPTETAS